MTKALLRTPESFFTVYTGGRHRTFPIHFGRLKMAYALKPDNGGRLASNFNGGQRKITTLLAKAEGNSGNRLDEIPQEYVQYRGFESVHIWWDVERCPLPLNFDAASKLGSTVRDAIRRLGPVLKTYKRVYFHAYGNFSEWIPKIVEDIIRSFHESGLVLSGFELIDHSRALEENFMMADLCFELHNRRIKAVHMVVGLEGKASIVAAIHELRGNGVEVIRVRPDEESLEVEGVWRWEPLLPPIPSHHLWNGLITAEHYRGSNFIDWDYYQLASLTSDEGGKEGGKGDEEGKEGKEADGFKLKYPPPLFLENDKIVNVWWDLEKVPLPSNFDARKIVASNITGALRHFNICGGPINLYAFGRFQWIWEDVLRFVSESGFQLIGFRLKDPYFACSGSSMRCNQRWHSCHRPPTAIHVVITDDISSTDHDLLGCNIIYIQP